MTTQHSNHRWTHPRLRPVKKPPDAPPGPPWPYRLTSTCLNCKFTIRADIKVCDGPEQGCITWHPQRCNPVTLESLALPAICRSNGGENGGRVHPFHVWTQHKLLAADRDEDAPPGPPWPYQLYSQCVNCNFTMRSSLTVGDGPGHNQIICQPFQGRPVVLESVWIPTVCRSVGGVPAANPVGGPEGAAADRGL